MARYRRRPLEVEAVQFVAGKPKAIREFCPEAMPVKEGNRVEFFMLALRQHVWPGDWLVRTPSGEWLSYSADKFEEMFEPLEGSST